MSDIFFHTLIMAMTPVVELRGAIPYGLAQGLDPWVTYFAAVVGNMIPVPFIMIFIRRIFFWLRQRSKWLGDRVDWLVARAEKKSALVHRYALVGLVILVAIPLPGTGAWTGALVACVMDLRLMVVDQAQAKAVAKRFQEAPEKLYGQIIRLLLSETP